MMGLDFSPEEKPLPSIKRDTFMVDVFAYVESITFTKKNLMVTEVDERTYVKCRFMIHKALSFHPDLIQIVNLVNGLQDMSPRMEYEFFLNFIPMKKRRSGRWFKKSAPSLYLTTVQKYYGYNEKKAEDAMKILTIEQLAMIDNKNKKEDTWTFSGDMESRSS